MSNARLSLADRAQQAREAPFHGDVEINPGEIRADCDFGTGQHIRRCGDPIVARGANRAWGSEGADSW